MEDNKRIDKINYYLDIAETVASRATCLRKKYGTVIVKDDEIISTGYCGAPRGRKNCCDLGYCTKKQLLPNQRHGGYDACRSVHAEQNAIINASREQMIGATMYLCGLDAKTGEFVANSTSCQLCKRMIINAGIVEAVYHKRYSIDDVSTALLKEAGVIVRPLDEEEEK